MCPNSPGVHGRQNVEPIFAPSFCPSGQSSHFVLSISFWNHPLGHGLHCFLPFAAVLKYEPAAQAAQYELPSSSVICLVPQAMQSSFLSCFEGSLVILSPLNVCISQFLQSVMEELSWYWPAPQTLHNSLWLVSA
jgi:hypothetical protein